MSIKSALSNINQKYNPFISEKKNLDYGEFFSNYFLGLDNMTALGWYKIRAMMAWQYYKKTSPIFRAVNLISNEFASGISPVLYDRDKDTYIRTFDSKIPESMVLNLLYHPNFNMTGTQFKKALCASLMVTGDTYPIITGLDEPLEVFYENPKYITIVAGNDGYPYSYHVSKMNHADIYTKQIINGSIRFMSRDGLREILQIRDFNPDYQNGNFTGFSRLSPVYYEIEQYLNSNKHNLSLLKKGGRPSGAILYEGDLTDPQRDNLRSELRRYFQGADNAGEMLILESGVKKEIKELSINNRDMDFVKLKKVIKDSLYEHLEIPASFYDNSKSTMNNKDTDKENIYDFNVIPMTRQIYESLGDALLRRFKNGQRYEIDFIEEETPALKGRFIQQIKDKSDSGVFSTNEIRSMWGAEEIGEEGDQIYQPMNLIALGTDKYTQDNLKKPTKKNMDIELIRKELNDRGLSTENIEDLLQWHS